MAETNTFVKQIVSGKNHKKQQV